MMTLATQLETVTGKKKYGYLPKAVKKTVDEIVDQMEHLKAGEWLCFLLSTLLILIQVWLDLRLPGYMSEITTLVQTPGSPVQSVMTAGFWMLACALGSLAASAMTGFLTARAGSALAMRLRATVFDHTLSFSLEELGRFSAASFITRCTSDVTQVQRFVTAGLQMLMKAPVTAVWAIRKIAGKNMFWTLSTVVTVAAMMLLILVVMLAALPKIVRTQKLTDSLNRVSGEHLTGIRVVHAYHAYQFHQKRFQAVNGDLTRTNLFVGRAMALLSPFTTLMMNGLSLAIYFTGTFIIELVPDGERLGGLCGDGGLFLLRRPGSRRLSLPDRHLLPAAPGGGLHAPDRGGG